MCTTNIFTYVYQDGHREQSRQPTPCSAVRHGLPCVGAKVFQHPPQMVSFAGSATAPAAAAPLAPSPYLHPGHLPPTPTYTPRSSTPNSPSAPAYAYGHRSGDESDRSHRSSPNRSSPHRRHSNIYVNGQRVVQVSSRGEAREARERPSRSDRIVIVDGPPTPRTPPQSYPMGSHSAPSSPNNHFLNPQIIEVSPRTRSSRHGSSPSSRRPVLVDDRHTSYRHARHTSGSSNGSRRSYYGEEDVVAQQAEEIRRQREEDRNLRRLRREADKAEDHQLKIQAAIAKANANINARAPLPVPDAPVPGSSASLRSSAVDIVDGMNRLSVEEQKMPRRRATVGPGSRRPRVSYTDGVYRWE